jgi:DNA-binding CsgD family transcriptional regulator
MHVDQADLRREQTSTSVGWFELGGRTFSLVPVEIWRRRKSGIDSLQLRAAEAVGRIEFDGARLMVVVHEPDDLPSHEVSIVDVLTRREVEVALLVAKGKCDKEIARALGISGYTVREHLRRTAAKLGVSRRTAIVSIVLQGLNADVPGNPIRPDWQSKRPVRLVLEN